MKKALKIGLGFAVTVIVIIIALGIYKFNYLQDDIYYINNNNESVKWRSDEAFKLGETMLHQENYNEALFYFTRAVEIDGNNLSAKYWRMFCEYNTGMYAAAITHGNELINLIKENNVLHNHIVNTETFIGLANLQTGSKERAVVHFNNALNEIENKLKVKRSIDDIMNKATLLCYSGKKEEALSYINSIDFTPEELKTFGGEKPADLINQIDMDIILKRNDQ